MVLLNVISDTSPYIHKFQKNFHLSSSIYSLIFRSSHSFPNIPNGKVIKLCIIIPIPQPPSGCKNHNSLESEITFIKKASD